MTVRRAPVIQPRPQGMRSTLVDGDPQATSRLLSSTGDAVAQLERTNVPRFTTKMTLPVGATRINHGLGRVPTGMTVTPTTADATWAWAMTDADARTVTVTTVGIAQAGAGIEVF